MIYYGIKTPDDTALQSHIWWISDTRFGAWQSFFSHAGKTGDYNPSRAPLADAIRAYEGIGYTCVELDVNEKRMHPLHDKELVQRILENDESLNRRTGRTTILALKYIVKALENPHEIISIRDHHNSTPAHENLLHKVREMTNKLGLEKLSFNRSNPSIMFG